MKKLLKRAIEVFESIPIWLRPLVGIGLLPVLFVAIVPAVPLILGGLLYRMFVDTLIDLDEEL